MSRRKKVSGKKGSGARRAVIRTRPGTAPKVLGGDKELGNFIEGRTDRRGTGDAACRAVLAEVPGVVRLTTAERGKLVQVRTAPMFGTNYEADSLGYGRGGVGYGAGENSWGSGGGYASTVSCNPQDQTRKFLPMNGGCIYPDMSHVEACVPESVDAFEYAAGWLAMLLIVREAQRQATARLPEGERIVMLVNNSDGLGNSYGGHINVEVTRRCYNRIFKRCLHYLLQLASFQISSICFTGAGKVGSENGAPRVDFQLTQRGDFTEMVGPAPQTTYARPEVNSRDESLCGPSSGFRDEDTLDGELARIHCISYDSVLCPAANVLQGGTLQICLAMLEQDYFAPDLILADPLEALQAWGHDPSLNAKAELMSGQRLTAVEFQMKYLEHAAKFIAAGRAEGVVPRVNEVFGLWLDTLERLEARDFEGLVGRLDWVLRRTVLERAMEQRPGLSWDSPEMKVLDHAFCSLDDGLFWTYVRSDVVEKTVSDGEIERLVHEPPRGTRAWFRAKFLQRIDEDSIVSMNWDKITCRFKKPRRGWWTSYRYLTLPMNDPTGHTESECRAVLDEAGSIQEALVALGAYESNWYGDRVDGADDEQEYEEDEGRLMEEDGEDDEAERVTEVVEPGDVQEEVDERHCEG